MCMCTVATTPPFDAHAHLLDAMKVAAAVLTASAEKLQVFLLTTLVKGGFNGNRGNPSRSATEQAPGIAF